MTHTRSAEQTNLRDYLDHYRDELVRACEELTAEQMAARPITTSTLSLLGLVRHLAYVEHYWTRRVMEASDEPGLFGTDESPDADFDGGVGTTECVDEAWHAWRREVEHAREYDDACVDLGATGLRHGEEVEYRDLVVHLIEEYARHLGHADLIREAIDGRCAS